VGPEGPMGPIGPIGPQGPTGEISNPITLQTSLQKYTMWCTTNSTGNNICTFPNATIGNNQYILGNTMGNSSLVIGNWSLFQDTAGSLNINNGNAGSGFIFKNNDFCLGPSNNNWCLNPNPNNQWLDLIRNNAPDAIDQGVYHFSRDGNIWLNRSLNPGWIADSLASKVSK
jgi:hypothetical protein